MATKINTIEEITNAKGLYFEVIFQDFWEKSPKFKKSFLKEISKKTFVKFPKNMSDPKLYWINKDKDKGKAFDFELNIQHNDLKLKYLIDVKYRTNKENFQEKQNLNCSYTQTIFDECSSRGEKCILVYVLWTPNFNSCNLRKSNFISFDIIVSKFKNW